MSWYMGHEVHAELAAQHNSLMYYAARITIACLLIFKRGSMKSLICSGIVLDIAHAQDTAAGVEKWGGRGAGGIWPTL